MIVALALVTVLSVPVDPVGTMVEAERAWIRGDEPSLDRCAEALHREDREEDGDLERRYALAYVHWRRASFYERGSKPFEERLKLAEELLERLLDDTPAHAEALALFGTVNGGLITSMWSGMRRGPRADKAYDEARELAPANPRVAMHQGVSRLFRPRMFGGGTDKAQKELEAALALFEKESMEGVWPHWGHAEIHGWLGLTMLRRNDREAARAHYRRALQIEPGFHWVLKTLLPELDAAEGER